MKRPSSAWNFAAKPEFRDWKLTRRFASERPNSRLFDTYKGRNYHVVDDNSSYYHLCNCCKESALEARLGISNSKSRLKRCFSLKANRNEGWGWP